MRSLREYAVVTGAYWVFTVTDGALRMLVLLHLHGLGYTPIQIASMFLFYEFFGVVTNLVGGWVGARIGLTSTLFAGLALQIVAVGSMTVPAAWLTPIIVRLQLWVSIVGVGLLRGVGLPILREGNVIQLPGGDTLFVAEACSGITSLVTLLPLGVFIAYFTEHTPSRRAALIIAVVPIAMLGNLLRVVGTVIASWKYGVGVATQGPIHDWSGVISYVLACLALLGLGSLMRRAWPEPTAGIPS